MDELNQKPARRRRKPKPTPMQIFKEQYLPFLILAVAAVMIVIFLFGAAANRKPSTPPSTEKDRIQELLQQEAQNLKTEAAVLAEGYNYQGAMDLLASYSGGLSTEPSLQALYEQYQEALEQMVVWDDLSKVPGLSFRTLVADLEKAKADPDRGSRYAKNYVTVNQFYEILTQLYEGGYVLVSLYDFGTPTTDADGKVSVTATSIRLPEGKKPIILTQEGVNFYSHTQKSGGFASCLTLDAEGNLKAAMTAADGSTILGNYDFVPILNEFVEAHPDFSHNGARATIAVSGYDGLFGYELSQTEEIGAVAKQLREDGYDIACYTYADMKYALYGAEGINEDMGKWNAEILPLLGETDILVYPTGGDIRGQEPYSGSKYEVLRDQGFRYFSGTESGVTWGMTAPAYLRHLRTVVTPDNLANNPGYFTGLFDPAAVLAAEG